MKQVTSFKISKTSDVVSEANVSLSSGYSSASHSSDPLNFNVKSSTTDVERETMKFGNSAALRESMRYVLSLPLLCDVTFIFTSSKEMVSGVKAILATRSRIFYQLILAHERKRTDAKKKRCNFLGRKLRYKSSTHKQKSSSDEKLCIPICDYDVPVFRKLIAFVHTGSVTVDSETVIGVLCAAAEYGFDDLRNACWDYAHRLLESACVKDLLNQTQKHATHIYAAKFQKVILLHLQKQSNKISRVEDTTKYHIRSNVKSKRSAIVTKNSDYDENTRNSSKANDGAMTSELSYFNTNLDEYDDMDSLIGQTLDEGFLHDKFDDEKGDFDTRSCASHIPLLS